MRLILGVLAVLVELIPATANAQILPPLPKELDPPGCAYVISWGAIQIADPDSYMESWRTVPEGKPEYGPPWSEGVFVVTGDPSDPTATMYQYRASHLTMFGLVREIYSATDRTGYTESGDEALSFIYKAADAAGVRFGHLGSPGDTIPHQQALDILEAAFNDCMENGKAKLPE